MPSQMKPLSLMWQVRGGKANYPQEKEQFLQYQEVKEVSEGVYVYTCASWKNALQGNDACMLSHIPVLPPFMQILVWNIFSDWVWTQSATTLVDRMQSLHYTVTVLCQHQLTRWNLHALTCAVLDRKQTEIGFLFNSDFDTAHLHVQNTPFWGKKIWGRPTKHSLQHRPRVENSPQCLDQQRLEPAGAPRWTEATQREASSASLDKQS